MVAEYWLNNQSTLADFFSRLRIVLGFFVFFHSNRYLHDVT